jgi:hypothetical protein
MAAAAETKKTTGVVRGTIEYASGIAFGLYSRVEQFTVVKATVNLTKPLVPVVQPVVKRAVAVADPWVDSVDSYATPAWKNVNTRVIEPATLTLTRSYTAVLDFSDRTVDAILPRLRRILPRLRRRNKRNLLLSSETRPKED